MNATANTTNLTDGMRLTVEALKKNGIDTIFGVVGIPVTDLPAMRKKKAFAISAFVTNSRPATLRPPAVLSPAGREFCLPFPLPVSSTAWARWPTLPSTAFP